MRDIKFRGLNNETGEFVYGYYTKLLEGTRIIDAIVSEVNGELTRYYIHDRETITEYTGLKDKNDKEIYEGDIIMRPIEKAFTDYHGLWSLEEVVYINGQWVISHITSEHGKLPHGYTRGELLDCYDYDTKLMLWAEDYKPCTDIERIGNIHENPELLEDQ